jgi:hypothetical protein
MSARRRWRALAGPPADHCYAHRPLPTLSLSAARGERRGGAVTPIGYRDRQWLPTNSRKALEQTISTSRRAMAATMAPAITSWASLASAPHPAPSQL